MNYFGFRIALKKVDEAIERLNNNPNSKADTEASVLEKLLKIDRNVAVVMAIDMLLAGVDTVKINYNFFTVSKIHIIYF